MNGIPQLRGPPQNIGGVVRRNVPPPAASPGASAGKRIVMRLKCRYRPLHSTYLHNGQIVEMDTDVTFYCADGGVVKGHKIILASSSKFFTNIFVDQKAGEMSTVFVPDIRSDVMKLLLLMTYKEDVVVTAEQMERLKETTSMFSMNWDRLKRENPAANVEVDVKPGKIMDSPQKPAPPPLMAKPAQPSGAPPQRRMGPSSMVNNIQSQQGVGVRPGSKPQTAVRTGMHQNSGVPSNNVKNNAEQGDDDSDGSEESNFTFQLQGYEPSDGQERRKSKLTPRVETETDDIDETDVYSDPVESQRMIKEWMARVGKIDDHTDSKRRRLDSETGKGDSVANYECTVCNAAFVKEKAWRWHEERHVGLGLFKCARCDQLLKTGRSVWIHEQTEHAFCGISVTELEEPRAIPANFKVVEARGRQNPGFRNTYGQVNQRPQLLVGNRTMASARLTQLRRLKASKMAAAAMKKVPEAKYSNRNPLIGIGVSMGSENLDSRKIKQLHWLYVCGKCDNCADSSTKAVMHFKKCFPLQGILFENTVTKYRQGFYGKSKCPLCPRRYAANGGFMIHCGHQHNDYRRLFSHTGAAEDKLKCVNCERKFSLPEEFHEHLDSDQECNKSPINEESMPLLSSSRSGSGTPTDRKRRTLVSSRSAAQDETPVSLPPRSARLAQRASLAAMKALAEETKEEPKGKGVAMRRESGIDYPPADCPICGATEVANISQHLASDHHDLDVTVNRISPDLLRCRKCLITFAICDLLAHTNTCTGLDKVVQDSQQRDRVELERPVNVRVDTKPQKEAVINPAHLPPGIGSSPIDRIENTDLFSKKTLEKAMICGVCGKIGEKLGDVANCLRGHGVHRCVLCFNSYTNRSDYPIHLKKCHGSTNVSNKLKCPLCNKTFGNAGQVAGHMYSKHWLTLLKEIRQDGPTNCGVFKTPSIEEEAEETEERDETAKTGNDETMEVDSVDANDERPDVGKDTQKEDLCNDWGEPSSKWKNMQALSKEQDIPNRINQKDDMLNSEDGDEPIGSKEQDTPTPVNQKEDLEDTHNTDDSDESGDPFGSNEQDIRTGFKPNEYDDWGPVPQETDEGKSLKKTAVDLKSAIRKQIKEWIPYVPCSPETHERRERLKKEEADKQAIASPYYRPCSPETHERRERLKKEEANKQAVVTKGQAAALTD